MPWSNPPVLEAVPNLSVGADARAVFEIVAAARATARGFEDQHQSSASAGRANVVDVHLDPDHDRSVVTVLGWGRAFEATLVELARQAVTRIDLAVHDGVHPRIGALDVMPIVALDELVPGSGTVENADATLLRVAAQVGGLGVPVLRYGHDAAGVAIAGAGFVGELRRGGPEGIAARIAAGEHKPMAGPDAPHPTAGVVAAGVRHILVALNVDLDIDDLEFARHIATRVRERSGGADALPGVRALGVGLASRGRSQVTMNIERYRSTSPARALERVAAIASEAGVGVHRVELVGLAPRTAVAQLRYACAAVHAPLSSATEPAIEWHLERFLESAQAGMQDFRL